MFKPNNPKVVYANDFINLTKDVFRVYDTATGSIWGFPPEEIPSINQDSFGNIGDYIVVNDESIKSVGEENMNRVCRICHEAAGRHDIIVARISLVNNPEIEVRIRDYGNYNGKLIDD